MSYGSKGVIAESGAGWKRRSTGLLVILGIILFHQVPLFAGNNSNGGTAGAFTRLGFGARSLGMGNAVIACHGFSQLLYENPAAIHGAENPAVDLTFQKLSLDRRLLGLSALLPLPPSGALAVEVLQSGVGDLPEITFEGEETGRTFDYRENLYALGFALSPASFLSFGKTIFLNMKCLVKCNRPHEYRHTASPPITRMNCFDSGSSATGGRSMAENMRAIVYSANPSHPFGRNFFVFSSMYPLS